MSVSAGVDTPFSDMSFDIALTSFAASTSIISNETKYTTTRRHNLAKGRYEFEMSASILVGDMVSETQTTTISMSYIDMAKLCISLRTMYKASGAVSSSIPNVRWIPDLAPIG